MENGENPAATPPGISLSDADLRLLPHVRRSLQSRCRCVHAAARTARPILRWALCPVPRESFSQDDSPPRCSTTCRYVSPLGFCHCDWATPLMSEWLQWFRTLPERLVQLSKRLVRN